MSGRKVEAEAARTCRTCGRWEGFFLTCCGVGSPHHGQPVTATVTCDVWASRAMVEAEVEARRVARVETVRAELEDLGWREAMIWTAGVLHGALELEDDGEVRLRVRELADGLMASLRDKGVEL